MRAAIFREGISLYNHSYIGFMFIYEYIYIEIVYQYMMCLNRLMFMVVGKYTVNIWILWDVEKKTNVFNGLHSLSAAKCNTCVC